MPFVKFAQSLNLIVHDRKRKIKGTFREITTKKIIKRDIFDAVVIGKGTPEETYKVYLRYFNHTIEEGESEREFVSAEWEKVEANTNL